MPHDPLKARWNDGSVWNGGFLWSSGSTPPEETPLLPATPIPLNTHTTMQPHEITKERAILSLTVWTQHAPALKIGNQGTTELEALIDQYEPLVQLRAVKQDEADAAYRAQQTTLAKLKLLGTRVAQIIEGHHSEDVLIMKDLKDVYQTSPRSEGTILERARMLYPLWVRVNTARAAHTPALPPITRMVQGVDHTVAMFKALLDGYTTQVQARSDADGVLAGTKKDLEDLNEETDALIKKWYKVMKASYDPGSPEYEALGSIPTEGGTPAPGIIEISTVVQGGENGLHVEADYVPGGGEHATTRLIKWMVVGVDTGFTHSEPLEATGNVIGPFVVGNVVKLMTEVSNSSGTRTSAERTITIEPPIV